MTSLEVLNKKLLPEYRLDFRGLFEEDANFVTMAFPGRSERAREDYHFYSNFLRGVIRIEQEIVPFSELFEMLCDEKYNDLYELQDILPVSVRQYLKKPDETLFQRIVDDLQHEINFSFRKNIVDAQCVADDAISYVRVLLRTQGTM